MAGTAQGLSKVTTYKKETVFGEPATGTSGGQTLRRVSSNFNLTKETYQSEEIRQDYQMADFRHGGRSVDGTLSAELSAGSYSDFFASALARDFTEVPDVVITGAVIAKETMGYSITGTGDFLAKGIRVGMVLRLTGSTEDRNNNNNLLVVSATATVLTVVALGGNELKAATGDVTAKVQGKVTYAPNDGHTNDSYTFEEWYGDIKQSEVTVGNKVNTLGVSLPATGLATAEFSFLGQDLKTTGTKQHFTKAAAQTQTGVFAAVNGALVVDGKVVSLVTSANININRNLTSEPVVGTNVAPEIYNGRIIVDGDLSTLFQDRQFSDYFKDESEVSLVVVLTENNLPNANFISITLPRIKLGSDTKDDGEKGIVSQNSYQALKGTGGNGFEATTIMIQDSAVNTP